MPRMKTRLGRLGRRRRSCSEGWSELGNMAFWTDKHCDECFGTGLDPQGREDTLCAACHGYGAHPLKVETSGWQMARSLSARQISIGVNGFIKSKLNILSSR